MQITIDPNNNKTVSLTVEEKRTVMIDELNQRKGNLSEERENFAIDALNL